MLEKLSENIFDKLTIDFLRNQVLKNAYGNSDTVIARLDPRLLILWYLFFGVVPWFLQDVRVLLGLFLFLLITASLAKIAPLVLFLFGIGVFTQTGYLLLVSLLFGGNGETVVALLVMTLKVAAVSLASITVFSGLERAGMVWLPGTAVLFHFLRLSAPSHADGRVSEHSPFLPAAGKSARRGQPEGENPVAHLSGEDHHARLLSADAEHGKKIPDHRGGPGAARLPLRFAEQKSEADASFFSAPWQGGRGISRRIRRLDGGRLSSAWHVCITGKSVKRGFADGAE